MSDPLDVVLSRLIKVNKNQAGYTALCPSHDDNKASLSISEGDDGRVLLKCFAGCRPEEIIKALGLKMSNLFPGKRWKAGIPSKSSATVQPSSKVPENKGEKGGCGKGTVVCNRLDEALPLGCTLEDYATDKQLPVSFLRKIGLSSSKYMGIDAIRIPYYNVKGEEVAVQFRIGLQGDRYRWKKGSKPFLYGLNRDFKSQGFVILCEGPSDSQTLWFNGFPCLGLPCADGWKEERDAGLLDSVNEVYIVIEPDQGGETVKKWLSKSRIRDRAKLISFGDYKDPSALYLHDPSNFKENFRLAMTKAVNWTEIEKKEAETAKKEAWSVCHSLADSEDILQDFTETIKRRGVAGEEKTLKLIYLALTSRYLLRPVSIALKGPSSVGKSFEVESVLKFFPSSAYYALTAMSEHSLAYSNEPLKNRFLILYEAAGMSSDFAGYLLRSLLSEGCIRYETIEKTPEGMRPRLIEREGPTGTIITTTAVKLHPENETRFLSLTVSDTQDQTRNVLLSLSEENNEPVDLSQWQALQRWLDFSEHSVVIPYKRGLAERIPPLAVRLRRDFTQVLNLITSHAILHQAKRKRDSRGRIVATIQDYSAIRELVSDIIADGIGATVSETIRGTVEVVKKIIDNGESSATVQRVATDLKIDKSSALRRIRVAIEKGYLLNMEKIKGKPAKIILGEPLPKDLTILPLPEDLKGCMVADETEGVNNSSFIPKTIDIPHVQCEPALVKEKSEIGHLDTGKKRKILPKTPEIYGR